MQREQQLQKWIEQQFPERSFHIEPASADASFRRYFRVHFRHDAHPSLIAMDAPPEHENCHPFIQVAQLFQHSGVHVPAIYAQDLQQGFLLLSDLGSQTLLCALQQASMQQVQQYYQQACDALIQIQRASTPDTLPDYDAELLRREMQLYPEWYINTHLGAALDTTQQQKLQQVFERIIENNLAQSKVWVHRDFHSRNLMITNPCPGILDFQDAVYGPITYDLVSLFKDAYIYWNEATVLDWLIQYWEKARAAGLPVNPDFGLFYRDYDWMGVQRHLKILGIFARLYHRDNKAGYLDHIPLVRAQLRHACARYIDLKPLLNIIDSLEPEVAQQGLACFEQ